MPRSPALLLLSLVFASACSAYREPADIALHGAGEGAALYALSKESRVGRISPSNPKKLSYALEGAAPMGENLSLELEYRMPPEFAEEYQAMVTINDGAAWELPLDASFLGIAAAPGRIKYAVPLEGDAIRSIAVDLEKRGGAAGSGGDADFTLYFLGIVGRWYGFALEAPQGAGGATVLRATPFVFSDAQGNLLVDPPGQYRLRGKGELRALVGGATCRVEAGTASYEWGFGKGTASIALPAGAFPEEPYPLRVVGGNVSALSLSVPAPQPFPAKPITADPGIVLSYSKEAWRDPRYELFQWVLFPSILILDTADYAIQDRLLKRLAFFTEKAGFRGRLASDQEIAGLHGWNAHDYRAEDLARFFEAARSQSFPLLPEERELEAILVNAGIILRDGASRYVSGEGAIISISQESPGYLRSLFMAHEGFHGLFFIDEDFRRFSSRRWDSLAPAAKRFIRSYFEFQRYDMNDPYLAVNEFMAHCLQQPAPQAARYFGETLAGRISEHAWRHTVLPPKDEATGSWPELADAFSAEAQAFSAYVNTRWGLAAGRVWNVLRK
jgi:hypothetical protein